MSDTTPRPRRQPSKNTYTTRSGKTIKLNRSLGERMRATKEAKARRKAAYLSALPREPWKRVLYRMQPQRLYRYWFSREGGIMALKVAGIGFVVVFLMVVGLFAYFRKDLPKIKDITGSSFPGSITYYDRTGKVVLFQDYNAFKRIPVQGNEISKYMREATVATEDKDFYKHGAFDVKGILRAGVHDATGGGGTQGGSTITQQLVKLNEGWTNDRTVSRKAKELILAVELEREYSKDDILTGYLNIAPYGNVDYGVQSSAQDYFGVDASQLTLAQSALLAAIPKAPGTFSPFASPKYNPYASADYFNKDGLVARQQYILNQMAKQSYITQKEADAAKKIDIIAQVKPLPSSHYAGIKAPYLVFAAKGELQRSFPASVVKTGGWKVITTVDMNLQTLAEKSVADGTAQLRRQHADNAAFLAEDNQTGQVVALLGGLDFNNTVYGQNNYATDINISPGSSVKPYDYSTFINNNTNVGAGSVLYDQVGPLPGYPCTNKTLPEANQGGNCLFDYDRASPGATTLRYALGGSRNIPAAKAMLSAVPNDTSSGHTVSINKVVSTARALMNNPDGYRCYKSGISISVATQADETQCYTASAIGDGAYLNLNDHVNGIASLARLGKAIPQTFILKVTNSSGKVLKQFTQPVGTQAVKADAAYIVNDMAADPNASYLSGSCTQTNCSGMKFHRYKGWHNAVKTGTTNDLYDGLMMSWNTKYTAGIWVGNHTRTDPYTGSPEYMTDPIVKAFMEGAIDQLGDVPPSTTTWTKPSDIKTASAYVVNKRYAGQVVPSPSTDLYPSWYVGKTSGNSQTLDRVSGKVVTSCTPELARLNSTNSIVSVWNVDIFNGGNPSTTASTSTSTGSDDVHSCSDSSPSVSVTAINGTSTNSDTLTCPSTGCSVMVHVEQGTHPLSDSNYPNYPGTVKLLVNGQVAATQAVNNTGDYQLTYKPTASSGSVQLEAQVIDSVLYSGTDTQTVTITSVTTPQTTSSGNSPDNKKSNGNP
jgi:membrane peptidoglycan carboxypeptidase